MLGNTIFFMFRFLTKNPSWNNFFRLVITYPPHDYFFGLLYIFLKILAWTTITSDTDWTLWTPI